MLDTDRSISRFECFLAPGSADFPCPSRLAFVDSQLGYVYASESESGGRVVRCPSFYLLFLLMSARLLGYT